MQPDVRFTQFAQSAPLFTLSEARKRYAKDTRSRSLVIMLQRLKHQGRIRQLTKGVYAGALAAGPLNRYRVPTALREDAVLALHSALEWHGVANQVFQTVYYFSARARKDVVFENVTYRRVAPPRALARAHKEHFQTQFSPDRFPVTSRERSFVDCLLFLDHSGGVEELDKSLGMFPSFDFDAALEYLKFLRKPWLYSRLGFLLDRHADKLCFRGAAREQFLRKLPRGVAYLSSKRPGNRWVPAWRLMVPETLAPSAEPRIRT
jgi:predicted transcriptional regulator of viral defense system